MRWIVILASLRFTSYHPSSKAVFCRSLLFPHTLRSSSHISTGLTSQVTVRTATTIAESGKASSSSQAQTVNSPKIRLSGVALSTQGNTKFTESPARKILKKETSSAIPAVQGNFKAAHTERKNPSIANSVDARRYGDRYIKPSKHAGRDNRSPLSELAFKTADRKKKIVGASSSDEQISGGFNSVGVGSVSARMSKEGKAKLKARTYESSLDAEVGALESKHTSKGQAPSTREGSFGVTSKAGNAIRRPVDSVGLLEDSDPSESMRDDGVAPECSDKDGNKPKKPFLQIARPVTVFSEWWFYCFLRGYRPYPEIMYHLDKLYLWLGAYQRVHLDATGYYVDGHSAVHLSKPLEKLKFAVTDKVFRWGDTKKIYVHSPIGSAKENPSSSSDVDMCFSFQDRVVQEVLYLVLEPMFEAKFSTRSHASRPCRGAHTALRAAQRSFLGCTWFINGDLSILREGEYAMHLVDSVCKVLKDSRVSVLLNQGFSEKVGPMRSSFLSATQGSCGRLKHLLQNVLLDPLDWWMDEQISNFSKRERPPSNEISERSPLKRLSKSMPMRNRMKQLCKVEYVRYGTKFWVGCSGTETEVNVIQNDISTFLKQKFGKSFESNLSICHISDGVNILDHVISQKVVNPLYKRRKASSGRVFEKRAFGIKLQVKASMECCSKYLKEVGTPASLQHIDEVLAVLDCWYCYAQNKEKVLEYCKSFLCFMYFKGKCKEGPMAIEFEEQFKKAMETVGCPKTRHGHLDIGKDFIRIPEHEKVLREHVWLQSRALTTQIKESFKNMSKTSPQQHMSQVLWRFLKAENGGQSLDDEQMLLNQGSEVNVKLEELAESVG